MSEDRIRCTFCVLDPGILPDEAPYATVFIMGTGVCEECIDTYLGTLTSAEIAGVRQNLAFAMGRGAWSVQTRGYTEAKPGIDAAQREWRDRINAAGR